MSERELDLFQKEKLSEDEIKKVDEKDVKYAKHVRETLGYFIAYNNLFSTWLAKGNDFDVKDVRDALSDFDQNIDEVYKKVLRKSSILFRLVCRSWERPPARRQRQ